MSAAWLDWLSAFYESLKEYGLLISKESFALCCNGFFTRPEPPSQDDGLTILERRIQTLCIDLGLDLKSREIQNTALAVVKAWQRHISLDPDALRVLQALKPEKTLALISNFDHPPHIYSLLSELGLDKFFETVVISGDVEVKKPDPYIFSLALERTKLHQGEVVYVGDASEDAHGARAAGIVPILIQRDRPDENRIILDFNLNPQSLESKTEVSTINGVKKISRLAELIEISL
jgi:putative hydrolase of the HAD superfamily